MTTVTAVKRALEEAAAELEGPVQLGEIRVHSVLRIIAKDPTALTVLANRLSDRGEAGNEAAKTNLAILRQHSQAFAAFAATAKTQADADTVKPVLDSLAWAIDQLTPPERAQS